MLCIYGENVLNMNVNGPISLHIAFKDHSFGLDTPNTKPPLKRFLEPRDLYEVLMELGFILDITKIELISNPSNRLLERTVRDYLTELLTNNSNHLLQFDRPNTLVKVKKLTKDHFLITFKPEGNTNANHRR